jgi:hypothetical protein
MGALAAKGEQLALTGLLATVYVSLHTATAAAGANEITGNAYARESAAFTQTGSDPTTAANSAIVTFPTATGSWGTITDFALWDASTAGNLLGYGTLSASKIVGLNDVVRFLAGALTVTMN